MSKPEVKLSHMDSMLSGFVLDPAKCSRLSLGEKIELVHEIAQCSKDAPTILSSFTRRELLEIICAEMGKERKYTGYTKCQMIEHLLKLVSQKSKISNSDNLIAFSASKTISGFKRPRQKGSTHQLFTDLNDISKNDNKEEHAKIRLCQNAACRATLRPDDAFCKRCSCCICHCYDDNKDPSLWLICGSDDETNSCGISCHLKCALEDERAGIMKSSYGAKLDGSFYCVSCRKVNGLMRSWRRQLAVAKEARRVDVLCLRISLGNKILMGTKNYEVLSKIVEAALQTLENEVGPLNLLCTKMARGIVSRLSCGPEVLKLCASALELFDSMSSDPASVHIEKAASCKIRFEELTPTSVVIVLECGNHLLKDFLGCTLWHRESTMNEYPKNATFISLKPQKKFKITNLNPSTEYACMVSPFGSKGTLGVWEAKWITPTSSQSSITASNNNVKRGNTTTGPKFSRMDSINSSKTKFASTDSSIKSISPDETNRNNIAPPSTPCKSNPRQENLVVGCKRQMGESDYDYSVRVIKWLERESHIEHDFRVRFLTWFSLKATMQERRVVAVYVDTMIDDPPTLAEQLIHTFLDEIHCDRKLGPHHGLCTRLWH